MLGKGLKGYTVLYEFDIIFVFCITFLFVRWCVYTEQNGCNSDGKIMF